MTIITTFFANLVLQKIFKGGPQSRTAYLGLHSGDPGDSSANEIHVSARDSFINDRDWAAPVSRSIKTNKTFTVGSSGFAGTGLPSGTSVTHLGFWTQRGGNGGSVWLAAELTSPIVISTNGKLVRFAAGDIEVNLTECASDGQTQLSDYCIHKVLNWFFRGANIGGYWEPSPVQLSLHSDDPGVTGANEISGRSYARQSISPEWWATPSDRRIVLSKAIDWPDIPTATITYAGIWDKYGEFLFSVILPTPVTWLAKYTARLEAGKLKVALGCVIELIGVRFRVYKNGAVILDCTDQTFLLGPGKSGLACLAALVAPISDHGFWDDLAMTGDSGFSFGDNFNLNIVAGAGNADNLSAAYTVLGQANSFHVRSNQYVPGQVDGFPSFALGVPNVCPSMENSLSQLKMSRVSGAPLSTHLWLASRIQTDSFPVQFYVMRLTGDGSSGAVQVFFAESTDGFSISLTQIADEMATSWTDGDIFKFETTGSGA